MHNRLHCRTHGRNKIQAYGTIAHRELLPDGGVVVVYKFRKLSFGKMPCVNSGEFREKARHFFVNDGKRGVQYLGRGPATWNVRYHEGPWFLE